MEVPGGRVLEDDSLQQHVLAVDQAHHHRTKETLHTVPVILRSHIAGHIHVGRIVTLGISLRGIPQFGALEHTSLDGGKGLPLVLGHFLTLQGPPVLAVAIDDTLARDGDVLGTIGTQGRLAPAGIESLERGLDEGIEGLVGSKENDATFLDMQIDVTLEHNRTGEPHATGHHQPATTFGRKCLNGLGKGIRAKGLAIAYGTEVGEQHLTVGNLRSLHL